MSETQTQSQNKSQTTTTSPVENVDPNEIKKFADLASRWWDFEGEFKPLHDLNPLRLDYVSHKVNGLFEKNILDVGCGGGILSESMARKGADVLGIDLGHEQLAVAKLHALETGIKLNYQKIAVEAIAQSSPKQYDVVTCMEMLEHVPDPASIVKACAELVKDDGHVFFSTINKNFKAYLFAIIGAEKVLKMVPDGTHDYKKLIKPSALISWAEANDLKVRDIIGLHYNPINGQYRLGEGVDVNYMIHCQKIA
ncbi:MAG: bifunctional 2-polyprenyl-6-hydroxyphenol methylase/3-demethylubiquinol 3-O-methyltransferase UbiG [Algicola sp.]|nr:bifunctional 2-polyprenyl-6-hydroxyphenol methylase/3-demethylubiquinol 3-O-methyltransferase UbiG [Algicola sp.]